MLPDYSEAKENMVAQRYRKEQDLTRIAGLNACKERNLAVELYAGMGGETRLFKPVFKRVITNDKNKNAPTDYHLTAEDFLLKEIGLLPKIDLIDFDAYGCPSEEIKSYFYIRNAEPKEDLPLVITVSDGLGIWMKRKKDIPRLRARYLLGDLEFDERHPWREHKKLVDVFMHKVGEPYGAKATTIELVQTKHQNYVLGAWLYE